MRHFGLCLSVCVATFCCVLSSAEQQKRAPSGFTGVRGKKSISDAAYDETTEAVGNEMVGGGGVDDVPAYVQKRAPSGFLGMRGKKPFDGWISQDYSEEVYKRAPSGFMGMRGKKEMDYGGDYDKRAPSGFFGMRGKKTSYDLLTDDTYSNKRAPSGFFGMRGKKEYADLADEVKRAAPENRFFGMRGKKQPGRTGFFGMRGKKYPYDFRGKFVGVRGKKSSGEISSPLFLNANAYDDEMSRLNQDMDLNQLMSLLAEEERSEMGLQNQKSDGYIAQPQI